MADSRSPRNKWPFPTATSTNFFESLEAMVDAQDASVYASQEDRQLVVMGGGDVSFTASSGVLSWSADIQILCGPAGLLWSIAAGSVTLADSQVFYVQLTRAPVTNLTVIPQVSAKVPLGDDYLLFGIRRTDRAYFRNGTLIKDGETLPIFSDHAGGGGSTPTGPAGGDLGNSYPNPSVLKVHGATVPLAGALTTGTLLGVTGAASLGYALLVNANVDPAAAIAGTKVSPNFGSQNLVALGGRFTALSSGYVKSDGSGNLSSGAISSGDLPALAGDTSGAPGANTTNALTGTAGTVAMHGTTFSWDHGVSSPAITQGQSTTGAGSTLSISAQAALISVGDDGGDVSIAGGAGDTGNGGVQGSVVLTGASVSFTSALLHIPSSIASPQFKHDAITVGNVTATSITCIAQNSHGTDIARPGGHWQLQPGKGTGGGADGSVVILGASSIGLGTEVLRWTPIAAGASSQTIATGVTSYTINYSGAGLYRTSTVNAQLYDSGGTMTFRGTSVNLDDATGANHYALFNSTGQTFYAGGLTLGTFTVVSSSHWGVTLDSGLSGGYRIFANNGSQFIQLSATSGLGAVYVDTTQVFFRDAGSALALTLSPVSAGTTELLIGETASFVLDQTARGSDAACKDLNIKPQRAFATATGTNRTPGNLVADIGAPTNSGSVEAGFLVKRAGSLQCQISSYNGTSFSGIWLGNGIAPASSNFTVLSDNSTQTYVNAPTGGTLVLAFAGSSGTSGSIVFAAGGNIAWATLTATPALTQSARTTDVATFAMNISAQNAWASAVTNITGGNLILSSGKNTDGTTQGQIGITPTSISGNLSGTTYWNTTGNSTKFTKALATEWATPAYSSGTGFSIDASLGNNFKLVPTDNVAFTIANPTNLTHGQHLYFRITRASGAMGALSWGTKYKLSQGNAPVNPGSGFTTTCEFVYHSGDDLLIQVNQAANDVAN